MRHEVEGTRDDLQQERKRDSHGGCDIVIMDLDCEGPHLHDIGQVDSVIIGSIPWLDVFEVFGKDVELCTAAVVVGSNTVEEIFERLKAWE
jgi:hypothetical protein